MERLFRNAAFFIDPEEEQSYSQATRDILSYVRENCPGPLSLSEIAKDRSWNIDYMIRSFRRDTGMTPHKYIALVKADYAASRAREGRKLQELADLLGYASVSSLSASFKNVTNRSLSEFRQRGTCREGVRLGAAS